MSTTDAAAALGCSPATVRKRISDGVLAAADDGNGNWRVSVPAELVVRQTEPSAPAPPPPDPVMTGAQWLATRVAGLPALLTVEEAADLSGFTIIQVRNLARRGVLPSVKFGRWVRIPTAELLDAMTASDDRTAA